MSPSFDLPRPRRVTVGAIGTPGKRVFYLQARQEDELVSLKLEKEQIMFLAGGLSEVLADLATPGVLPDDTELALEEPVQAAWAVGSMQLAYDASTDRVVLVAREARTGEAPEGDDDAGMDEVLAESWLTSPISSLAEGPPDAAGPPGVARVLLTREQAAGVIEHGKQLLRAGRPACPLCGYPLDEEHSCPKTNGHRAPSL